MQRRPIERSAERRKSFKIWLRILKKISEDVLEYFKIWWGMLRNHSKSEYETWKWIIPNMMKNHSGPTWQAEKEFCESAHFVFICRPWKEEHILKILLSYFTSWWQKMVVVCLTKKSSPGVLLDPFCIFCIISEKRWKWCSPGLLLGPFLYILQS